MADLQTKLQDDMKAALRAGQKDRLQVIRMLLSDVQTVDLMPGHPTPESVVEAYAKKLRKGVEEYTKLNKPDTAARLRAEIAVVKEYLPKRASVEETDQLVAAFLADKSFTPQQAGQATGQFMKAHAGAVDAGLANTAIRKRLAGS